MKIKVIPESPDMYLPISRVICSAFGEENEAVLVEKLRENNRFIPDLSLGAFDGDRLLGHILLFPVDIIDGSQRYLSLSLAPLSVDLEHQNMGIGSILTDRAIERAREHGFPSIVVLGDPGYYPRFGFKPASLFGVSPPFTVPDDTFMILELLENGLRDVKGSLQYPEEYSAAT